MTFEEAKQRISFNLYSRRFEEVQNSEYIDHRLRVVELAADLYARAKWDEACDAQKERLRKSFSTPFSIGQINASPKPEFKP